MSDQNSPTVEKVYKSLSILEASKLPVVIESAWFARKLLESSSEFGSEPNKKFALLSQACKESNLPTPENFASDMDFTAFAEYSGCDGFTYEFNKKSFDILWEKFFAVVNKWTIAVQAVKNFMIESGKVSADVSPVASGKNDLSRLLKAKETPAESEQTSDQTSEPTSEPTSETPPESELTSEPEVLPPSPAKKK